MALIAAACGCPTFEGAHGRLVDQNGKPIAGAIVKAVTLSSTDDVGSTTTSDETGAFRLPPSDFRPHGTEACQRISISISKPGCNDLADTSGPGDDFVFHCSSP